MDDRKNWGVILLSLFAAIIVIAGAWYLILGSKQQLVSPVPAEPSFKVIYYTPTPGPITPSSTPSATPKVKAAPTKLAPTKAEASPTITPKVTSSPSATPKP